MKRLVIVGSMVVAGAVGGWLGYWLGHALGWTDRGGWLGTVSRGDGAILVSIAFAVAGAFLVGGLLLSRTAMAELGLTAGEVRTKATVVAIWDTGTGPGSDHQRLYHLDLEVHPPAGPAYLTSATVSLTDPQRARLYPGGEVEVRYDPTQRLRVTVIAPNLELVG